MTSLVNALVEKRQRIVALKCGMAVVSDAVGWSSISHASVSFNKDLIASVVLVLCLHYSARDPSFCTTIHYGQPY